MDKNFREWLESIFKSYNVPQSYIDLVEEYVAPLEADAKKWNDYRQDCYLNEQMRKR